MWTELQSVFEEIESVYNIPYSRQGSYEVDETLPNDFFTFWNVSSNYDGFYNNKPSRCKWVWKVFYYTNNPENIYSGLEIFIEKARSKGFSVEGAGKDLLSDEPDYFGRYVQIEYSEDLKK